MKNYDIVAMFSQYLYKFTDGSYANNLYKYFKAQFPATLSFANKEAKLAGKNIFDIIGDALKSTTGVGNGGTATLREIYFDFCESFMSNGGYVYDGDTAKHTVMLSEQFGYREYIEELYPNDYYSDLRSNEISLVGYGAPPSPRGATHDALYYLYTNNDSQLTIIINDDGNDSARYYLYSINSSKLLNRLY
jgi:hypothetical protein